MVSYGTARAFALTLGLNQIANLLQENFDEGGSAIKKLMALAEDGWIESGINSSANSSADVTLTR